jgi:hypothetical protein
MKAIQHLSAYCNPAQSLRIVEVSKPNVPSASEALVRMVTRPELKAAWQRVER